MEETIAEAMDVDKVTVPADEPVQSIEGWVVILTNVHEEAAEEDLQDLLADFGPVRSLQLNLDRRTGYVKGYALAEYAKQSEAQACIDQAKKESLTLLGQTLQADYAFVKGTEAVKELHKAKSRRGRSRDRSISPDRRS